MEEENEQELTVGQWEWIMSLVKWVNKTGWPSCWHLITLTKFQQ